MFAIKGKFLVVSHAIVIALSVLQAESAEARGGDGGQQTRVRVWYTHQGKTVQSRRREVPMRGARLTMCLVLACMLLLLVGQTAFGAIRTVKLMVPACE